MSFIEVEKSIKNEEWSMLNLHSHTHYEIYFLNKGKRTFLLSNELYQLTAPVLIIIPPHVLHKTEGSAFERYNVNVSENYLDEFQKHVLDDKALKVIKLDGNEPALLGNLFDEMCKINRVQKYSDSILRALFSYLIYHLYNVSIKTIPHSVNKEPSIPTQILKIIDYLNDNFASDLSLSSISEKFYISKGALIYNFNKYMKCTPAEYLLSIRLAKAKEYLQKTNKSIGDVAELCGFYSANYFGLIFKKKENLSPLSYRKHEKGKI